MPSGEKHTRMRRSGLAVMRWGIRLIVGGVLVWSGLIKTVRPYEFLGNVYEYRILGEQLGAIVAASLPWVEVVVGICILANVLARGGYLLAILMACMFICVQLWAMQHDLRIACGCFGASGSEVVGPATLGRTAGLLLMAVVGFLAYGRSPAGIPSM